MLLMNRYIWFVSVHVYKLNDSHYDSLIIICEIYKAAINSQEDNVEDDLAIVFDLFMN